MYTHPLPRLAFSAAVEIEVSLAQDSEFALQNIQLSIVMLEPSDHQILIVTGNRRRVVELNLRLLAGHDLRHLDQTLHLRVRDHLVCDKDIFEPSIGHHLTLPELGDGDAFGSGFDLHPGDGGGLVCLDVWAKRHPKVCSSPLHLLYVPLQRRPIDE